ncbi:DUF4142 domain-containing protein [Cereibacter sp. SYSU M97828]|nr:DUF4142 domain-containing protein [Cereibacter flavus]
MTFTRIAACFALALATPAFAQTKPTPEAFAAAAASSNMLEIRSSQLALEVSEDPAIRAFAEQMIRDHRDAGEKLSAAAMSDGVAVPEELAPKHADELDALADGNKGAFDANYLKTQQLAHEEAVTLFEDYSSSGPEGELRTVAGELLPILREHKAHADGMTPADATPE